MALPNPVQLDKSLEDKAFQALQLLNAGTHPRDVMNQLQGQGLSDNDIKHVMQHALFENKRELYENGAKIIKTGSGIFNNLKIALPLVLLGIMILTFIGGIIGFAVALISAIIFLAIQVKKKTQS